MKPEELLELLPLSGYERKAYLALLKVGRAPAAELSRKSGVPYGRIYQVLALLADKGMVATLPLKPKVFVAIEPRRAVAALLNRQRAALQELETSVKRVEWKPPVLASPKLEERTAVTTGRCALYDLLCDMLRVARREMCITAAAFGTSSPMVSVLATKAAIKGVKVKLLINSLTAANTENARQLIKAGVQMRVHPGIRGLSIAVRDTEESSVSVVDPKTGERVNVHVLSTEFAVGLKAFFDAIWNKGKETGALRG